MSDEVGARTGRRGVAETVRLGSSRVVASVRATFASRGAGFRSLAQTHAGSVAGDTLVALALANTLFFSVPSAQARDNVALYLLLTLAPFAVIGPFLGRVFSRLPTAYRASLVVSSGLRVLAGVGMAMFLDDLLVLLPLAFVSLVFSRFHGIARSSVLPVVVEDPYELISANAHLARLGVLGSAIVLPFGGLTLWVFGPVGTLILSSGVFAWSAVAAFGLPTLRLEGDVKRMRSSPAVVPRSVRLARFATAGVRFLNGFLLLLIAFALREGSSSAFDLGAVLVAAGVGYFLAAVLTPVIDRHMGEEPMVVAGLALEAGAAFISAQLFGVPAAAALAAAAGLAWGTAKFGFDGLLQATVPVEARGRSFTNAETFFQAAWVVGALIPVVISTMSAELGLSLAGLLALFLQVVYISAVLVPAVAQRRATRQETESSVLDIM